MMTTARTCATAALLLIATTGLAGASSSDAWDEFANSVREACEAQAEASMLTPEEVVVDPFGSEDYGMAIVYGRVANVQERQMAICVYSKKSQAAQIGSQMNAGTGAK